MGRHIPIVSFLCGVIFRRKPPAVEDDDDDDPEENTAETPSSTSSSDDGRLSMEDALSKPCSPEAHQQPLPLPPGNGNFHMRTVSCGHNMDHQHQQHHHHRSNSGVGKLMSSMSLKVMGGGGGGGTTNVFASLGSASGRFKERTLRYFKHEESVWKKTIILGERCRVPDEDDDDINLYDEKGNKITTYHPKAYSGLLQQYSRQNSHQE